MTNAVLFVLLSGVVFFGWGEIFSLFPSTLTDTFGTRFATANYGWLYISFGIGSIFGGPLAALLHQHTGSWIPVFGCAIVLDFTDRAARAVRAQARACAVPRRAAVSRMKGGAGPLERQVVQPLHAVLEPLKQPALRLDSGRFFMDERAAVVAPA